MLLLLPVLKTKKQLVLTANACLSLQKRKILWTRSRQLATLLNLNLLKKSLLLLKLSVLLSKRQRYNPQRNQSPKKTLSLPLPKYPPQSYQETFVVSPKTPTRRTPSPISKKTSTTWTLIFSTLARASEQWLCISRQCSRRHWSSGKTRSQPIFPMLMLMVTAKMSLSMIWW